jgi:hypothetical protein
MKTLSNPYLESEKPQRKVGVFIDIDDLNHIGDVCGRHGTVTLVITRFFKSFIAALDNLGIHDASKQKEFLHILAQMTDYERNNLPQHIDGGSTGGSNQEAEKRNDPGRAKRSGEKATRAKSVKPSKSS